MTERSGLVRALRHLGPHLRRQRLLIAGSSLALVAEVGLRLLEPWPLKIVVDRVLGAAKDGRTGVGLLDGHDAGALLLIAVAGVVVVSALRATAAYGSSVGFALVGNRVLTDLRADLYDHLQRLPLSFHTRARAGDLTIRVIADIGLLREVAVTALLPLVGHGLVLAGIVAVMLRLNAELALLALLSLPLFVLLTTRMSRRIHDASRKQRRREGTLAATAAEAIAAIKSVQALSLEPVFAGQFAHQNRRSLTEGVRASRLAASLERGVDLLTALGTAIVLWRGARLVLDGALTPGDLLVFLAYLRSAFRPLRDFAKYTGRLARAGAAGERVLDLLEREPEVRDLPGAREAPPFEGEVLFDRVAFAYEPGRPVLDRLCFRIEPGQVVALVGPSGAGKSTVANLLLRLYDPTDGRVDVDGHDVRAYTIASLRRQVSVVLQETLLFAGTVRENIAAGRPGATDQEIVAAAVLANADEFVRALPQGYDTVVGERGATLSGGQRQRIALARAAVRRAPILLLDEPTTGLDEENARAVGEALLRLGRRATTLLITHDLALAARADRVLHLEAGRVLEQGSHDELLRLDGRYATLHRRQRRAEERAA